MLHSLVYSIGGSASEEDGGHKRCNGNVVVGCEKGIEFGSMVVLIAAYDYR